MSRDTELGPLLLQLDYLEWRLALLEAFIKNRSLTNEAQAFIQQVEENDTKTDA